MKLYLTKEDILAENWEKNPVRGDRGCVYLVADKVSGEIIYAGKTSNARQRLAPCRHDVYRSKIHDLYILQINDEKHRREMEERCIALFKPQMNHRLGFRNDNDVSDEYNEAYYRKIFG